MTVTGTIHTLITTIHSSMIPGITITGITIPGFIQTTIIMTGIRIITEMYITVTGLSIME